MLSTLNGALLQVVSYQFETDAKLLDVASKMKDAFRFSTEAHDLDDRTKVLLKSKIKDLLDETSRCSLLVREYAARSFTSTCTCQASCLESDSLRQVD